MSYVSVFSGKFNKFIPYSYVFPFEVSNTRANKDTGFRLADTDNASTCSLAPIARLAQSARSPMIFQAVLIRRLSTPARTEYRYPADGRARVPLSISLNSFTPSSTVFTSPTTIDRLPFFSFRLQRRGCCPI